MCIRDSYQIVFTTPDGHEPTTGVSQPTAGSSYINANGQTQVFSLPADGNTGSDSACTFQHVNAGYVELPVVIPPTIANDDKIEIEADEAVAINFLANDEICEGTAEQVDILGHNVPGNVVYNAQQRRITVTGVTEAGTYSIEYGVRGACGSYDTAAIMLEVNAPPAPCLLYTSPSPRDATLSRMPSSA